MTHRQGTGEKSKYCKTKERGKRRQVGGIRKNRRWKTTEEKKGEKWYNHGEGKKESEQGDTIIWKYS